MEERRKHKRFKLRLPAKIELVPQDPQEEARIVRLESSNISFGGAFFDTPNPLPEGTPVRIDFALAFQRLRFPGNRRPLIRVRGNVLRSEPTGMAIRFLKGYTIVPHVLFLFGLLKTLSAIEEYLS